MRKILLLYCILLAGCSSIAGHVSVDTSEFDNSVTVDMRRIAVDNGIVMGLFWTSADKDSVTAMVGMSGVDAIGPSPQLEVRTGAVIQDYAPIDGRALFRDDGGTGWSFGRYHLPLETLEAMIAAESCVLRIHTGIEYADGEFSKGGIGTARGAAKRFLARVREQM